MPSYGVNHDKPIELVSCSYAVGVKRLPLMHDSVRAAARLLPSQNVRWTHIGDGPMLANLRLKVAQDLEPNLTVRFLGHLDPSQVIAHYSQNAIDLFLSTSQNEGVPVSIMEAFSCGIPVVGPHVGGVPEIVDASSGVLVPIDGSPGAFAQAIVACMSDTQAHLSLREGARIRWANYYRAEDNFERFAEALEALDTERASRLSPHTIQNQ
jgi:glycosyltransferase involved in cell wall biosynthesis